MSSRFGVLIVGCGWIGTVHARAWARNPEADLYYWDSVFGASQKLAKELRGTVLERLESLAVHPEITVIDVCLPHDQHVTAMQSLIPYQRNILLEKPVARNMAEAVSLSVLLRHYSPSVMVAECFRFHAAIVAAREVIQQGRIGSVLAIHGYSWQYFEPLGWRRNKERTGGGTLLDRGIHLLSMMEMLGGAVDRLTADTTTLAIQQMEGEDTGLVNMQYRSGAIGHLAVSWGIRVPYPYPLFIAHGSHGVLYEHESGVYLATARGRVDEILPPLVTGDRETESIEREIDAFSEAIRQGTASPYPIDHGIRDLALVMAAYESERTGARVTLSEFFQQMPEGVRDDTPLRGGDYQ